MVSNKERLQANNAELQELIGMAEALPDAGSGGGVSTVFEKDVNFYDYDGTLLYSFTIEEAQALTELPELPTQPGLICQGWTLDLNFIKTSDHALDVGAMYITDDEKTRLYISLCDENVTEVAVCFQQSKSGCVTINWGDGSEEKSNGTTSSSSRNYHTYASAGEYVISLEIESGQTVILGDSSGSCLGRTNIKSAESAFFLKKAEIGSGISNTNYAFYSCYSLETITMPKGITKIGNYTFHHCYALKAIVFPDTVTEISAYAMQRCSSLKVVSIPQQLNTLGNYAFSECGSIKKVYLHNKISNCGDSSFSNCYALQKTIIPNNWTILPDSTLNGCASLQELIIPESVTSIKNNAMRNCASLISVKIPKSVAQIGNYAFYYASNITVVDFSSHETIPTLGGTSAFSQISAKFEIRVPAALYDEWKSATNWSSYASKIVAV